MSGTGTNMVNLTINGVDLQVPHGELIVEAVKRIGLEIPVFCYHPRMDPVGMCRMCLVEVGFKQPDGSIRMMPKPQAGCTLPASEGMVIVTDSESVHRDRKGVLEFLLANHPLDCPICDRGGECPLQNNTLAYGPSTSRFIELKRHLPKAYPLSKYVTLDLERCIQCGRCVRFTEEISGEAELAFRFRGANMQPSTFQLLDFESKFSGNVIEICPVGALTSSQYRFKSRPWDLETTASICTGCSQGCNVWFDHRAGKFVRINGRTNEEINEEWTCDKGKFGHNYYNQSNRISKPMIRQGENFVETTWADAYDVIATEFQKSGSKVAGFCGHRMTNEGMFLMKKLFADHFGSNDLDHRPKGRRGLSSSEATFVDFESAEQVVVFGCNLANELPMAYLRLRKCATKKGVTVHNFSFEANETDGFATSSTRLNPGSLLSDAEKVAATLKPGQVVLTSVSIFESDEGEKAHDLLKSACQKSGAKFNCWAMGSNERGAEIMKLNSEMNENLFQGKSALWIVESELESVPGGAKALESSDFLVYQGSNFNETATYASVILPMAAPAEQDGTWTNCEGRVQVIKQAIAAHGESKPAWRIFSEILLRLSPETPFFNSQEVYAAMMDKSPEFAAIAKQISGDCGLSETADQDKVASGEPATTEG